MGLFPLGPSLLVGITAFPFVGLLFVVPRLEYGGGRIHGQLNVQDGEFGSLCLLLGFFHCQDEVWYADCIFVEEDHVCAQGNNVKRMESSGDLHVEEPGAVLEFLDVYFFDCSADEFLAAVFGCLPNTVVFSTSLVGGLGLLHFYHRCVCENTG